MRDIDEKYRFTKKKGLFSIITKRTKFTKYSRISPSSDSSLSHNEKNNFPKQISTAEELQKV